MGLRVSFDLSDDDLRHFRLIMREARKAAAKASPEDIVASAEELLKDVGTSGIPTFIAGRLEKLKVMINMLSDHEWALPEQESVRVLNALAYFCEPEDLIPDQIPGLGFLDDAIMIELLVRELRHEIDAYRDFCAYRAGRVPEAGVKKKTTDVSREQWLESRRRQLQSRMRRRRKRSLQKGLPGENGL
ncbi:MAG: YkvA family protein [Woeseia sp.]